MKLISTYIGKMSGGAQRPQRMPLSSILLAGIGALCAILVVVVLSDVSGEMFLMAPLGASCFLAFALPESPLAQPRHIILGHVISTAVGLVVINSLGNGWLAMSLAVGLAVTLMQLTRTGHAPAGADPLVIFALDPSWTYLLFPVFSGASLITLTALIFNNLRKDVQYPKYW